MITFLTTTKPKRPRANITSRQRRSGNIAADQRQVMTIDTNMEIPQLIREMKEESGKNTDTKKINIVVITHDHLNTAER